LWTPVAALGAVGNAAADLPSKGAGSVGCSGMSYEVTQFDADDDGVSCQDLRCNPPIEEDQSVMVLGGCDPSTASCSLTVAVEWLLRGNHLNPDGGFASMSLHRPLDGVLIGSCGSPSDWIPGDRGVARFGTGLSCAEAETAPPGTYTSTAS
jgi:hypothetical protein